MRSTTVMNFLYSVAFLLMCSASIFFFFNYHRPAQTSQPAPKIDAFVVNASYVEYDADGKIHAQLKAPKMIHDRVQNLAYFTHPTFFGYTADNIPCVVQADRGKTAEGMNRIDLWDHVMMKQKPYKNEQEMVLNTEAITLYPHQSYAETDRYVTIVRAGSIAHGIGMQANFKTGIFKLLSKTNGTYATNNEVSEKNKDSNLPASGAHA